MLLILLHFFPALDMLKINLFQIASVRSKYLNENRNRNVPLRVECIQDKLFSHVAIN